MEGKKWYLLLGGITTLLIIGFVVLISGFYFLTYKTNNGLAVEIKNLTQAVEEGNFIQFDKPVCPNL